MHIHHPKHPCSQQAQRIAQLMNHVEQSLYLEGSDEWQRLLDMDSFADWWIVHELMMNAEPNGPRSCFMLFDGKRLKAGPVWDFDLSLNPVGLDAGGDIRPYRLHRTDVVELTADSAFCSQALWYDALLRTDTFKRHVAQRWQVLRPLAYAALSHIDQLAKTMHDEARADQAQWGRLDPARFDTSTSWDEALTTLRTTFLQRIEWMDRTATRTH